MEPNTNPNIPAQPNPELGQPQLPEMNQAPVVPERVPQAPATAPAEPAGQAQPVQLPQAPQQPVQPAPTGSAPANTPTTGVPSVAGDVDVIEKEWVNQANKIVDQTKNDPHSQEEAVEALQIDYLKKRYGHEVKKPDEK